jgi:hypothetical protein
MEDANQACVHFERGQPMLRVENMEVSLRFHIETLGFDNAK